MAHHFSNVAIAFCLLDGCVSRAACQGLSLKIAAMPGSPLVSPIIFAKVPQPGQAKTRLIPLLGAAGAANLAHRLLLHTIEKVQAVGLGATQLCLSPSDPAQWCIPGLPDGLLCTGQGEGDLGERMARVCKRALDAGRAPLLMGTDCPECTADDLLAMALALASHDAVIAPAADGGYPVIGLKHWDASVFQDIAWSTSSVFEETMGRFKALGWRVYTHRVLHDIDEPSDLRWLPAGWPEKPVQG